MPNLNHLNTGLPRGLAAPPDAFSLPFTATIAMTSSLSGLSRSEIYRLLAAGRLRAVKSGRSTLILLPSVREHIASLPMAQFRAPKVNDAT
jgi:excisionase family DNA binding protein